ncbi:MAG: hypothetical protein LQ343_002452 [Gyalolechia ehrenbergii]|nr:MAG: hypothetical protein LQ343_002452 [Gyalolechia ehrenbergii]
MCIIERVHFIHPDGFREPKERLRHCQFGTPVTPCNDIRVFNVVDEVLYPAQKAPSPPHVRVMEPRATDRQHSPEHKKKPKKTYDDLKVVFDFHIPFASRHKKPESKPKKDSKKDPKEDGKMAQPGIRKETVSDAATDVKLKKENGAKKKENGAKKKEKRRRRESDAGDVAKRRRWAARIPGAPRHVAEIHHYHHYPEHNSFERLARDDFEQRGNQVLNEAIRARFEPRGPSGGPRLRRAIGGAERRIYDDQPSPVKFLPVTNLTSLTNDDPDLSPLVYHIPGTHDSLYIRPHDYALPENDFAIAIWRARVYIADMIASEKGKTNVPLPPDQDPKTYGSDLPVQISWQSSLGMKLTWGVLAAVMRGLDDCLVRNNHLPYVVVWHVFNSGQEDEVGWGMIGTGRPGAIS